MASNIGALKNALERPIPMTDDLIKVLQEHEDRIAALEAPPAPLAPEKPLTPGGAGK